jgi:hypothetical protein
MYKILGVVPQDNILNPNVVEPRFFKLVSVFY